MKIAIYTYTKWALGQIHRAIAKYSKHDVTVLDWRHSYNEGDFLQYDLIYVPIPQAYIQFLYRYPSLKHKVCCVIHGLAELYNYDKDNNVKVDINKDIVDSGKIPQSTLTSINDMGKVGCVSKQLHDIITEKTSSKAFVVECGADPHIFNHSPINHDGQTTVLCTTTRDDIDKSEHCYDVKRWRLAIKIESLLPEVKFVFLDKRVGMDEVANFYKQGDIILCLSHSEGNPLGLIEAGMMGVLPLTTKVGIVPDVFTNNLDSIILQSKDEDDIVCECVEQITKLNNDKNKLFSMRANVRKHLLETRTWNKVIDTWDSFFDSYNTKLRKGHNMQNKFRFHLLGLPHLPTSKLYNACAFTQKNVKLAKMLLDLGHQVFLYGAKTLEGPQPECTEFIETHTLADICQDYGDGDNRWEIGYDWQSGQFRHDINQQRKPSTLKYYAACISEINKRKRGDDFLLITQGRYQQPIDQGVGLTLTCEPGIGYRGSYCKYRAFESSYIQNFTYGSQHPYASIDGNYYDRIIPNYFSNEDVEFGDGKGEYYLYIGRMIARKGISTAIKTCNHLGAKLLLVGQGGRVDEHGVLHGEDFTAQPGTWEYVGYADFEKRKGLFANAIATFTPTIYCDPFCGTHVEAMLSGTPVVTTNFGVFPETVINGLNGYRCNTLQQFVDAAIACKSLDRKLVRQSAEKYLCGPVSLMYEEWFVALHNLYESMYDKNKLGWHRLRDTPPSS